MANKKTKPNVSKPIYDVSLPASLSQQPLLMQDPLYALPASFLNNLQKLKNRPPLDPATLAIELQLATHCERYRIVGFSRNQPVQFDLLLDSDCQMGVYMKLIDEFAALTKQQPPTKRQKQDAKQRYTAVHSVPRAYVGWLITHPPYRSELKKFSQRWDKQIRQYGLPAAGLTWMAAAPFGKKSLSQHDRYLCELAEFCVRWRLEGLASLELPLPLKPQLPILAPKLLLKHMQSGGFGLFLPDTFPVPSRDQLRAIGQQIQGSRQPPHLAEWGRIIRREKKGGSGITRFGHMLVIQHCMSILQFRHPGLIKGNQTRIDVALANLLQTSAENVRKLRRGIRNRLMR